MATLASIGALAPLGGARRANLWTVAAQDPGPLFAASDEKGPSASLPPSARPAAYAAYASGWPSGGASHLDPSRRSFESPLREMTTEERLIADYAGTGVT